MVYKLVIFDLDGTILNTLEDLAASVNAALRLNAMPERTIEEVRQFVGNGIRKLIERAVPAETSPESTEQVLADFRSHYELHCTDRTAPYEGIPALIDALRAAGMLTAVVSNKADSAVQKLCAAMFPGQFDAVAGEREGVRRKPAPDAVNAVLERFGIAKEEAVYIGDSDVDIRTAANAGMACISVDWGFRDAAFLNAHGAEEILSSPETLQKRLLQR